MAVKVKYEDGKIRTEYNNCFEVEYTFNSLLDDIEYSKEGSYYYYKGYNALTMYFYSCDYEYYLHFDLENRIVKVYSEDNSKHIYDYWNREIIIDSIHKKLIDADYNMIIDTILNYMDDFNRWYDSTYRGVEVSDNGL